MITVSNNKRYLEKNGAYFPYLADTAWTAIQRLTREEMTFYLDCRKEQGFNAIQVSALSELDGIRTPNREGQLPFIEQDVLRPNAAYFKTVLFFLDECAKRDMVAVLLPTWGDKFNQKWGEGPEIFTPENAYVYGEYLARLIGNRQDIIWMLGGDRPLETDIHRAIVTQMARGIRCGEQLYHLMTYHPCGETTSLDFLPECDWLDYHSLQSGHSFGGYQSEKMISAVLQSEEKPCMDAESFYEDFPIGFDLEWNYRLTPADIRQRIYRNMMVGGCGTVYGHQSVWCFHDETDKEYLYDWKTALHRPMAEQMAYINRLLQTIDRPALKPIPDCTNAMAIGNDQQVVVYTEKEKIAFLRLGEKQTVKSASWFNPVTGTFTPANVGTRCKTALTSPFEDSAILILNL